MSTTLPSVPASPPLQMVIVTGARHRAARVTVTGEVDLATSGIFRDELLAVLRSQRPTVLEVDLASVTFLDCAGLGALVAVRNAAVRTDCQVRVRRPRSIVRRILAVTGMMGLLVATPVRPGSQIESP